jgi:hypothetical protein
VFGIHHDHEVGHEVIAVILSPIVSTAGDRISAVEVGSVFIDNISTYLGLQVKCNPACPALSKNEFYQQICIFHSYLIYSCTNLKAVLYISYSLEQVFGMA